MRDVSQLQAILDQAEHELARLGDDLQFLVTPEGGVEVVRRGRDGLPAEPKRVVAELRGCDPMLWQAERPEGAVTLGMPYLDARPRCALSRRRIERGAPVDLYYRGRPLSATHAADLAPRLALVRGLVYLLSGLLAELETLVPRDGEGGPADGAPADSDPFRRWEVVWREMSSRLSGALRKGNGSATLAREATAPDEN